MCFKSKTATCRICDLETRIRSAHKILVRNHGVKKPLRNLNPTQGDNIIMDFRDIRYTCVDWFQLDSDRDQWRALVNIAMNLRVHIRAGTAGTL
jgi:hypothetical protein